MHLTLPLPNLETTLQRNRQRWAEVIADPQWNDIAGRIETDTYGQVIVNPPPSLGHGKRQVKIASKLIALQGDHVISECPILTSGGVRAADVGWCSQQRFEANSNSTVLETAPEICVEVLSPSNTAEQMQHKRDLYFTAGATECWECAEDGQMSFYFSTEPNTPTSQSKLCPSFPAQIEN